jgi:hypothetical protein
VCLGVLKSGQAGGNHQHGGSPSRWTIEEKVAILDEASQPHASITAVADRHGISRNLIYLWRRQAREGSMPGVTVSNGGRGSRPSATPVVVGGGSRRDGPGNGRRIVFGATLEKQVPPRLPESPFKLSGMNGTSRSHHDNERKRKLRSVETLGSQNWHDLPNTSPRRISCLRQSHVAEPMPALR